MTTIRALQKTEIKCWTYLKIGTKTLVYPNVTACKGRRSFIPPAEIIDDTDRVWNRRANTLGVALCWTCYCHSSKGKEDGCKTHLSKWMGSPARRGFGFTSLMWGCDQGCDWQYRNLYDNGRTSDSALDVLLLLVLFWVAGSTSRYCWVVYSKLCYESE